ncbi:MAG: hypothetical protein J2P32_09575 [Actinobacteria bacterium]|nr:hypothetical protein [Actinomycetota bacterium]
MHGTGKALRRGVGVAAGLALLVLTPMLAACGSSGPAAPAASASRPASSAGAYLNCLLQHRGGSPGSARQACAALRPADLAADLLAFENCLKAHDVSMPSLPAQGRRAALLQFVGRLRAGGPAQRSALTSCLPSGISG